MSVCWGRPEVAGRTSNRRDWQVGEPRFRLATRPLFPQHDGAARIVADVERVLTDIDADHGDRGIGYLRHGVLLVFGAPRQFRLLAGQEHGRTIPLGDKTASVVPSYKVSGSQVAGLISYSVALGATWINKMILWDHRKCRQAITSAD
jgi:hypothetical protein